jgi:hypothetical protein
MRLKWKVSSVHLEVVLILTQDRCTVCAKHTDGVMRLKWKLISVHLVIVLIFR